MIFERESLKLDINSESEKEAKYINDVYNKWIEYKKEMKNMIELMQDAWKKQEKIIPDNYFG